MNQNRFLAPFVFLIAFALGQESLAADRSNWKTEWEKTLNAARVEAQVTVFAGRETATFRP